MQANMQTECDKAARRFADAMDKCDVANSRYSRAALAAAEALRLRDEARAEAEVALAAYQSAAEAVKGGAA